MASYSVTVKEAILFYKMPSYSVKEAIITKYSVKENHLILVSKKRNYMYIYHLEIKIGIMIFVASGAGREGQVNPAPSHGPE
jgi:hypothetical protein